MYQIANALTPVIALILIGFILKQKNFLHQDFWRSAEKLTYFILMPAILTHNLAGRSISGLPWDKILIAVSSIVIASAIIITGWHTLFKKVDTAGFSSMFQGCVRFNTFVALAVSESLYGVDGLLFTALGAGFMIITINLLCVGMFSFINNRKSNGSKKMLYDIAKNPLILSCVLGIGLNLSGVKIPTAIDGILILVGKGAFPIGLMAVGAAYHAGKIVEHLYPIAISSVVQFFVKPAMAVLIANFLGLSGVAASAILILFSVPTAPSAYILSREMGGDYDSMASIITVQTFISFFTLPITIWIVSGG